MVFTYFQSVHICHYENCPVGTNNPGTYLYFPISFCFLYQATTSTAGCPLVQVKITDPLNLDLVAV